MALIKLKPTSPGTRAVVRVVTPELHKGKPEASLLEKKTRTAGRNHNGHITTRHMGGGHKKHYRLVDFKRDKDGVPAKVERLEYDPNRTAHLALLVYADGDSRDFAEPNTAGSAGQSLPLPGLCRGLSSRARDGAVPSGIADR